MISEIKFHKTSKPSSITSFYFILAIFSIMMTLAITNQTSLNLTQMQTSIKINEKSQMLPYHVLPVYGNASLGYYYVNLFIGSPNPQPQSVIIDTGSGILALPCVSCKQCGHKNHLHPPYNPQKSFSSKILTCQSTNPLCRDRCLFKKKSDFCSFYVHYAEGSSLQGSLIQDDIRLQSIGINQQIKTIFGCTQKETRLFFQQKANGIFGLAPKRQSNLLQQLFNRHSPLNGQKTIFSLCLSSNNGFMTVGGINTQVLQNKAKPDLSIPFKQNNNYYNLQEILQIKIGQMSIASANTHLLRGYDVIIDSGSTFTYVPLSQYHQIQKLLNHTCVSSKKCLIGMGQDSICYKLLLNQTQILEDQLDKLFPTFTIRFANYTLEWTPTHYMLLRNRKRSEVCMGLQPLNRYLLGANWMSNRNIVFDLDSKMLHIYDNIKCIKQSQIMGSFLSNPDKSSDLKFTRNLPLLFNVTMDINPLFLILGIVIILLIILIIISLCFLSNKSQRTMIVDQQDQQQSKNNNNTQSHKTNINVNDNITQQQ